ncbi:hypothetical protein E4T38_03429 [Aureobasidium subglaciale]|nr:hypothetical protein E4T38_03429 [Aureobasidium subglaciale]KAI5226179.1 hypothetical protein E4T40_03193 [Aureobasidium subglaciale]KAI5264211.1 hypothetical protein E4T46_03203 [Aureobasidium subglaciale]
MLLLRVVPYTGRQHRLHLATTTKSDSRAAKSSPHVFVIWTLRPDIVARTEDTLNMSPDSHVMSHATSSTSPRHMSGLSDTASAIPSESLQRDHSFRSVRSRDHSTREGTDNDRQDGDDHSHTGVATRLLCSDQEATLKAPPKKPPVSVVERPPNLPYWKSFWLWKSTIVAFACMSLSCMVTVVALLRVRIQRWAKSPR